VEAVERIKRGKDRPAAGDEVECLDAGLSHLQWAGPFGVAHFLHDLQRLASDRAR